VKLLAEITDIRINGRGGQGAVTASRLLAEAAILEGQYVHAFPNFGPERAGAPVTSFARISPEPFTEKTEVYEPHIVVVIDPTLLDHFNERISIVRKNGPRKTSPIRGFRYDTF